MPFSSVTRRDDEFIKNFCLLEVGDLGPEMFRT